MAMLLGAVFLFVSFVWIDGAPNHEIGDVEITIDGGNATNGGRLLVRRPGGLWGTVCNFAWQLDDTRAACRQLGFEGGEYFTGLNTVHKSVPIHLDTVYCLQNDRNITRCLAHPWGQHPNCGDHWSDVHIRCYSLNVTLHYGLVLVSQVGKNNWGTVCYRPSSYNGDIIANAACRQAGFETGQIDHVSRNTQYGAAIYIEACRGRETNLLSCSHSSWNRRNLTCDSDTSLLFVHCHNGSNPKASSQHVFGALTFGGGLICDNVFDHNAALAACRDMGFDNGKSICCSFFSPGRNMSYAVSQLKCTGHEDRLVECNMKYGRTCATKNYASVICASRPIDQVLEFRVPNTTYGRDGVLTSNIHDRLRNMLVCADSWTDRDAAVLCRAIAPGTSGIAYRSPYRHRWLVALFGNFKCSGVESRLQDCPGIRDANSYGSRCDDIFGAAAFCYYPVKRAPAFVFSMANARNSQGAVSGIPQISFTSKNFNVTNRYICNPLVNWGDREATVFCRGLNYDYGKGSFTYLPWLTKFPRKYLLLEVRCNGKEKSIIHCSRHGLLHGAQRCPVWSEKLQNGKRIYKFRTAYVTCYPKSTTKSSNESTTITTMKMPSAIKTGGGLTNGAVAAIVVTVLAVIIIAVLGAGYVLYKHRLSSLGAPNDIDLSAGVTNPTYAKGN
ncbi:scavenger receptor cysteine-rich domain superfamily protein-like [Tubulanus polymorphus]|uniref:scavenger receptor cysteine-rich domain superfamily protein-like n=1 Tax=Tubulanus polymorphus TaxID=672921 RepID=UPI003DA3C3F0